MAFNDKFDKDPWLAGVKSLTENLPEFLEEFMSNNKWFSEWLQEAPANTALFIAKPAECFRAICKEKKVTISPK